MKGGKFATSEQGVGEHDIVEVCNKARQGLDEYHLNKKLHHSTEIYPYVFYVKYLSHDVLVDECGDLIEFQFKLKLLNLIIQMR